MAYPDRAFFAHLEEWVKMQKKMLEVLDEAEKTLKDADRLDLIIASRTAFQHMIKTLKAFDQWLQDPLITSHMPREMLVEVREKIWKILRELLELDVKHTSEFKEYLEKLAKEGKLNPLLFARGVEEERPARPSAVTTM